MQNGFYTALGTPLDRDGNLIVSSFCRQIEDQIDAGVSGLLVMGSMGIEACIKNSEYRRVAAIAAEKARGRCPILVGIMDNSAARVMERLDSLDGLKIEGVVATTPFYFEASQSEITNFFSMIALNSFYPLYLYDLPGTTKIKIETKTIEALISMNRIKGIKTGDLEAARILMRSSEGKNDFDLVFSGLDVFDVAYKFGIRKNLDGMFSCMPTLAAKMYSSLEKGNIEEASVCLDSILMLRNAFVEIGVFRGYSHAMNLLGYEGSFGPDYSLPLKEEEKEYIEKCLRLSVASINRRTGV